MEIRQREDRFDLPDLLLLDHVPEIIAQEEQPAFGVVDDMDDIGRGEVLKDRHDHGTVGDRGDIGDAPARVVAADQGDFIAVANARLLEKQVQLGDLLRHFVIGEGLVLEIIGQSRHFAVFAKTRLVNLNQIFL